MSSTSKNFSTRTAIRSSTSKNWSQSGPDSGVASTSQRRFNKSELSARQSFIEICESEQTGDHWVVIHSGSRGLGANTSEYWQYEAIKRHDDRADRARSNLQAYPADYLKFDIDAVGDKELLDWLQGGKGEDFVNYEAIPREERETVRQDLKAAVPDDDRPNPDEALETTSKAIRQQATSSICCSARNILLKIVGK